MTKWIKILLVIVLALSAWWAADTFWLHRDARVILTSGETFTEKDIRQPLKVSPAATIAGRTVTFDIRIADAEGRAVREVRLPGNRRVDAPTVTVKDQSGNVVHTGQFQYG